MRRLPAFTFAGIATAALAGAAFAAGPKTHVMDVPLPDGSVAHIEYVGDVAPKVTVDPRPMSDASGPWAMTFPSFGGFDRMMQEMMRQNQEVVRQAQQMANRPAGTPPYVAAYGEVPAGGTSTTVVSVSRNGVSCTRTTEVVSQGEGKPPKVTSNTSGQCDEQKPPSSGARHPV